MTAAPKKRYCLDGRTATAHFPGIGRYVVNLARAMAPQLHGGEQLVILRDPRASVLFDTFSAGGSAVRIVDAPLSPFSLRQQWVLPRLLRAQGAHLYHSPYTLLPLFPGVPTLVTVHDLIPLLFPAQSSRKARLFFRAALSLALRTADVVLAVSDSTRQDLLRRTSVPQEKLRVCLEGVGSGFAPSPEEDIATVRRKFGLPARYVLYAGSNKPHKNLAGLLQAWRLLRSTGATRGAGLVIAGVWLDAYAPPGGPSADCRVLGRVSDTELRALYSGALCFVFPSYYEGFGLPVLEAMACGTPVLCSRRSSLPEVAGDAALYFDPNDPAEMAERIVEVLQQEATRVRLRSKGLARAARFSWERCASCTLEIYRSLAACREQTTEEG